MATKAPTRAQIAAARLRVDLDHSLGRETPPRILEIAQTNPTEPMADAEDSAQHAEALDLIEAALRGTGTADHLGSRYYAPAKGSDESWIRIKTGFETKYFGPVSVLREASTSDDVTGQAVDVVGLSTEDLMAATDLVRAWHLAHRPEKTET